jgi:ATP/maltotriose-dependent transcriptional regulator MalT
VKAEKHLALARQCFDDNNVDPVPGDALSASIATRACVALQLGFPDRARRMVGEALTIADRHNAPHISAFARMYACFCLAEMRSWRQLLKIAGELKEFVAEDRLAFAGHADFHSGLALLMLGKVDEGATLLRNARSSWEGMEYRLQRALELRIEAEIKAGERRYDEAMALVEDALRETDEVRFYSSSVLRLRADLLVHLGSSDQAEAAYLEAMRFANRCNAKFEQLETATHFARWLKSQGRAAEARTAVAKCYDFFTEGSDTCSLREARALLEELGAPRTCARPSKPFSSA